VRVKPGFLLLKKYYFAVKKVRFNVHSLTKGPGQAPSQPEQAILGRFSSYNYRKVSIGEHFISLVFIYLFFLLGVIEKSEDLNAATLTE
jgi:hypothetical protein